MSEIEERKTTIRLPEELHRRVKAKAALQGTLYAEAREQAINPKLASYSVLITDDADATVAIFQGMVYRKKGAIIPDNYLVHHSEKDHKNARH